MHLPDSMKIGEDGMLHIGDISAEDLTAKFSTPLLVLAENEIRKNAADYNHSLTKYYPGKSRVLYASKAFSCRSIYKIIEDVGLGTEVVSGGELYTALKSGFPPDKIYFHGNNKTPAEINMALENDIGGFFVDNFQEADMLQDAAQKKNKKINVIIRIKPGVKAQTHEYMITGDNISKFGVGIEDGKAFRLIKKIFENNNLELKGLHGHIGSQIYEEKAYVKHAQILFSFMAEIKNTTGRELSVLNLGGGLGVAQTKEDRDVSISHFVKILSETVLKEAEKHDLALPELMLEPGRSLLNSSGITLYTVGTIKKSPQAPTYVAVDGGMTDNIRPALYGARYSCFLAGRNEGSRDKIDAKIAGKCCESGDILIENAEIREPEPGDILAIPATGAYTYSLASNYNSIPKPAVVLVKNGEAYKIIERETYDDLLARDKIPPHLT